MHGGLALVVDRVDVQPEIQRHLNGLDDLRLGARVLSRGRRAEPRRHHERGRAVVVGQVRVGAQFGQQPHVRRVGGPGGEQEGGAADEVQCGDAGRRPRRHTHVQVRAMRNQLPGELEARHGARPSRCRIVAAGDARLTHPGELVQRGPAARRGIGVGAAIQQIGRQLEVGAAGGKQKRVQPGVRGPTLHDATGGQGRVDRQLLVQVRAGFQQRLDHVNLSLARREQQRREPPVRPCAQVRPVGHQGGNGRGVALGRGPHQCGLPLPVLMRVGVGAGVEQQLDCLDVAGPRRGHQRRLALHARRVRVGARVEQRRNHGGVAVDAGERERSDAVAVADVHTGARRQQEPGDLRILAIRSPVKGRRAVDFGRVHVDALFDQGADTRHITRLDRLDQRHIRRRGRHRQTGQ